MSNIVENFLRSMVWSKDATEHEKSLVAGNIRTFYHWLMEQQPHGVASWQARCHDAEDRLAQYESQCIPRTADMPEDAVGWFKERGHCFWSVPFRDGYERGDVFDPAPDLRPDEPGPVYRHIVDVE